MQKLLEDIVKSIVDKPDEVQVNINESENTIVYELNVGDGDFLSSVTPVELGFA